MVSLHILFCQILLSSLSTEVIIAPSMVYLGAARRLLRKDISIAVQNVCDKPSGAFTGETSVSQASDMGAQWAIIGHKERRMFGEKPEV